MIGAIANALRRCPPRSPTHDRPSKASVVLQVARARHGQRVATTR